MRDIPYGANWAGRGKGERKGVLFFHLSGQGASTDLTEREYGLFFLFLFFNNCIRRCRYVQYNKNLGKGGDLSARHF